MNMKIMSDKKGECHVVEIVRTALVAESQAIREEETHGQKETFDVTRVYCLCQYMNNVRSAREDKTFRRYAKW